MGLWLLFLIFIVLIAIFSRYKFQQKEKQHEKEIQNREHQISKSQEEKTSIEAKYLKKLKAAEAKKKNLAEYRRKKKNIRIGVMV